MGYRIVYDGPVPEMKTRTNSTVRLRTMVAAFFLLFSIFVRLFWPEGTKTLQSVFLPAQLSITEQAFSELVHDCRQGQPLDDAISVFCRRIIHETS